MRAALIWRMVQLTYAVIILVPSRYIGMPPAFVIVVHDDHIEIRGDGLDCRSAAMNTNAISGSFGIDLYFINCRVDSMLTTIINAKRSKKDTKA